MHFVFTKFYFHSVKLTASICYVYVKWELNFDKRGFAEMFDVKNADGSCAELAEVVQLLWFCLDQFFQSKNKSIFTKSK